MMKLLKGMNDFRIPLVCILFVSFLSILSSRAEGAASAEAEIYFSKGILAFDERKFEEAAIDFEKALQADPENPNILFQLGRTYNRLKELDDAVLNLEKAIKINPQFKDANYELGVAYFNTGEFEKALRELDTVIKKEPGKGEAYYYIGMVYFRQEKWKEAVPYFKKALEMVPDYSLTCHYYLGVSYFRLEEDKEALKEFGEAQKIGPGSDIGESSKKFVEASNRRVQERKPWSLYGSVSWQYDNNVTLKPSSFSIVRKQIPGIGKIPDKGDWRAVFNFSGEYKLPEIKNFIVSGRYTFYQSVHRRLRAYNVTGNQFAPTVSYKIMDPLRINVSYLFDYYELDETRYLKVHTFMPSFTLLETKYALLQGFYRYQDKGYFQDTKDTPSDRRGRNLALGVSQYLFFMGNKGYVRLAYLAEKEETKGRDWKYTGNTIGTDVQVPLMVDNGIFDTRILLSFNWSKKDYKHINSIFSDRRKDQEFDWAVEVVKDLNRFYSLSVRFNQIVSDSKLAFYNYKRDITSFNFTARF